jgi:hypothetical protein
MARFVLWKKVGNNKTHAHTAISSWMMNSKKILMPPHHQRY